ncbi:MAG: hypothetical protein ACJAZN_001775 [Planctomycetota bacterium]|jgi:hypothetical protein
MSLECRAGVGEADSRSARSLGDGGESGSDRSTLETSVFQGDSERPWPSRVNPISGAEVTFRGGEGQRRGLGSARRSVRSEVEIAPIEGQREPRRSATGLANEFSSGSYRIHQPFWTDSPRRLSASSQIRRFCPRFYAAQAFQLRAQGRLVANRAHLSGCHEPCEYAWSSTPGRAVPNIGGQCLPITGSREGECRRRTSPAEYPPRSSSCPGEIEAGIRGGRW